MSYVFVVDTDWLPLNPVHPGRARILLSSGKAAVLKRYPFTIILKAKMEQPQLSELRIKLDPGSKTTGIALLDDQLGRVVFAAELSHRGHTIKEKLDSRRGVRRSRRNRHTRYRKMCSMDDHGFPRTGPKAAKRMKGYQTGDLVRAVVPPPRKTAGSHVGRVLARVTGRFDIQTSHGRVAGVSYHYCRPIHRSDGYSYTKGVRYAGIQPDPADTTTQST